VAVPLFWSDVDVDQDITTEKTKREIEIRQLQTLK